MGTRFPSLPQAKVAAVSNRHALKLLGLAVANRRHDHAW
jgi:hypothetical protein